MYVRWRTDPSCEVVLRQCASTPDHRRLASRERADGSPLPAAVAHGTNRLPAKCADAQTSPRGATTTTPRPSALTQESVGALVGLMAGPVGMVVGAMTGTLAGAIRDFWIAGVDLDFVAEAERMLLPGKVALVAEVDEEWAVPVDASLEASGNAVFRRARSEVIDTQFDHAIGGFKGEIEQLGAEAAHSTGEAKSKLQVQDRQCKSGSRACRTAREAARGSTQTIGRREGAGDQEAARSRERRSQGHTRRPGRACETRISARGAKLLKALGLTKEALAV